VPQQPETAGAPLKAAWYHCECLFEAFKRTSYRTNALTDLCEIDLVGDEGGLRDEVALKVGAQLVLHRQWLDGVEEEKSRQEGLAYEMWWTLDVPWMTDEACCSGLLHLRGEASEIFDVELLSRNESEARA